MLQKQILLLLITFYKVRFSEESGYKCSNFSSQHSPYSLVECPPAKFMIEDDLVECFDNFTKYSSFDDQSKNTVNSQSQYAKIKVNGKKLSKC